ncbi:MAG: hypothetical protein K0S09_3064 [Sphingobacteriaceae bacterium]|nr:hypothetical protein [Sphingobacteriaceae bacterium]
MAYLRLVDMPLLFSLQFTASSFLWMLACLILGAAYAFLLYRSSAYLAKNLRMLLFALRTLAVALLAFLLFAPLLKLTNTILEKPLIIIAQDNSASIGVSAPKGFDKAIYQQKMQDVVRELSSSYDVRTFQFGDAVKPGLAFKYDRKLSDISSVFKEVGDQFTNRNIGAIILATDGIYNRGGNPQYEAENIKAPVYTVALGDTVAKRDILIANVNYNNIVYLDNQFQIEVEVEGYQSAGASSRLTVSGKSGSLFSKPVSIISNEFKLTAPVTLPANKKGIQRYTVTLAPIENELSERNNSFTFFVEVLDGKQKILIVANSPHPDISAIEQAVENNKNYEVKTAYINDLKMADVEQAGLVILHQLPSATSPAQELLKAVAAKPVWYILGAQSSVPGFSAAQGALSISAGGSVQEATAKVNPDFYSFTLSETSKARIQNFAPLLSPFGSYGLKGPGAVLLKQQIGKVATENPLLMFADDQQRKIGILAGEGIWRWRLEDFEENGNHEAVDELLTKSVQYLSAKDDKRKFRAYPARNAFDENENIVLNAELYNDSYELVNTPDVNLAVRNAAGRSYTFLFSRTGKSYVLDAGILPPGEYTFTANTQLGKNKHSSSGQFVIVQQQAEFQHTTANHQLLYGMSQQSGGKMIYPSQLDELVKLVKANEQVKTISYEERRYEDLINLKLIFFVILGLLTLEWFGRKRSGEV